jgi:hypothetical protein
MALTFPSLAFFQALQQRTKEAAERFEKLGYCDTTFGVKVGDELYTVGFEVYECVDVREGGDPEQLDFVLVGSLETWREMLRSILENGGAGAGQSLNTLTHLGRTLRAEFVDPEGHDKLFRFMATLQEFFDQAQHLDIELG